MSRRVLSRGIGHGALCWRVKACRHRRKACGDPTVDAALRLPNASRRNGLFKQWLLRTSPRL
ncbi:hypothetical protein KCU57_19545 [Xanthomonas translucens]|uniref:hypothetical protein n=1 Tax=Xanthomonas campestris pv. translucens TaxID=343 RepID=UPI001F48EFAD|nr:hypothetical protein [Xanthomonas translucens]UKE50806.1 hypothetical protein KCU57_19545 [Xanthomonas translucens]